jgi:hypothetical protein
MPLQLGPQHSVYIILHLEGSKPDQYRVALPALDRHNTQCLLLCIILLRQAFTGHVEIMACHAFICW